MAIVTAWQRRQALVYGAAVARSGNGQIRDTRPQSDTVVARRALNGYPGAGERPGPAAAALAMARLRWRWRGCAGDGDGPACRMIRWQYLSSPRRPGD